MSDERERLEDFVRDEDPDDWELIIRGRHYTPERLLVDGLAMQRLYTLNGEPVAAVSASLVRRGATVDEVLAERRLRTRRDVVVASAAAVVDAGFPVLPTFIDPHVSIVLPEPNLEAAERLRAVFGEPIDNPHYDGKKR